jgi:chromosome segregation ATPase
MSEERFDRLESQLNQVIQAIGTMQENMGTMQQNIGTIQQNIGTMQQNIGTMQQNIGTMQQNMATKQDLAVVQQTVSDIRTDIAVLSERVDSLEQTTRIGIRDSIRNQRAMINDLNYDLANNERATGRLRGRVERLEDLSHPNRTEGLEEI